MIRKNLARLAAGALVALLFGALPASAEITGVTFKTSRNVSFY